MLGIPGLVQLSGEYRPHNTVVIYNLKFETHNPEWYNNSNTQAPTRLRACNT